MYEEATYSDLRVMTLKRLAAGFDPQMLSEGSYVSLSNYHFIDIWPVKWEVGSFPISSYYEQREKRNESSIDKKVHVIQNMLLFGKRPDFWKRESDGGADILYITMVHFSNREDFSPGVFEKAVRTACQSPTDKEKISEEERCIPEENWCVYYALDFCDAVVFMRGCRFDRYQELLWDLTVRGRPENRIAVDTISLYGVSSEKVSAEFTRFKQGIKPPYTPADKEPSSNTKDSFYLAVFLSVQNENNWSELQQALSDRYGGSCQDNGAMSAKAKPAFYFYRKFGRTDITVTLPSIDLENALYVVWLVFCNGLSLDSCTLAPLSALPCSQKVPIESHREGLPLVTTDNTCTVTQASSSEASAGEPTKGPTLVDAEEQVSLLYAKVSQRLEHLYKPLHGYLTEIYLALRALLKNSFAEEYYLSVLPSFVAHLELIDERLSSIENARKKDCDWIEMARQLLEDDLREYYRGLMLLEHATVHGEKKYIQTPGLNAFICEVPAKLLAFYTALSQHIVSRLREKSSQKSYVPILIPDFRQDMYTHSLSNHLSGETQVGIIFLEERLFYEPEYTIPSMVHEIAHKVGDKSRHRSERRHSIFKCISLYLLCTVLSEDVLKEAESAILSIAEHLASFFDERFLKEHPEEAYLSNVIKFLRNTYNCMTVLIDEHSVLSSHLAEAVDSEILLPLLREKGWHSKHHVFRENSELSAIAWEIFFSTLLTDIWSPYMNLGQPSNFNFTLALEEYCKCLISVFSESYSDLRMLELVGCDERGDRYRHLLEQMLSRKDFSDVDNTIGQDPRFFWRFAAVCEAFKFPYDTYSDAEVNAPNSRDAFIICKTREELADYLRGCHMDSVEKDDRIAGYVKTGCADIFEIRNEIAEFRTKLLCSFVTDKQLNGAT